MALHLDQGCALRGWLRARWGYFAFRLHRSDCRPDPGTGGGHRRGRIATGGETQAGAREDTGGFSEVIRGGAAAASLLGHRDTAHPGAHPMYSSPPVRVHPILDPSAPPDSPSPRDPHHPPAGRLRSSHRPHEHYYTTILTTMLLLNYYIILLYYTTTAPAGLLRSRHRPHER